MPSPLLGRRREHERETSTTSSHQPLETQLPPHANASGAEAVTRRVIRPLPLTRHLSLEPVTGPHRREVSTPAPTVTSARSATASSSADGAGFLLQASREVIRLYPAVDRAYLLGIMQEHYPKCDREHIVQCTVQHFANQPNYPRADHHGPTKRKLSEEMVYDAQAGPAASRRRRSSSSAGLSEEDSFECELCGECYHLKATSTCPAGHLFCHLCVFKAASAQLNSEQPLVVCLDATCPHPFTKAALLDILPHEPLGLYDNMIRNHTLREINRVDSCPRCSWTSPSGSSLPMEQVKRFCCESCGAVTCRVCKQPFHGIASCKDAERQRRKSEEANSDSETSNEHPEMDNNGMTQIRSVSPPRYGHSSVGEGLLLPSLRSTLGSPLGKPLSQPSSPSFSFRLKLPPLTIGGPPAPMRLSVAPAAESMPRVLTDPWRYALKEDSAPPLLHVKATSWSRALGAPFQPLHHKDSIIHQGVLLEASGGSGNSPSRPRHLVRRATYTGRSLTAPASPVPPFQPVHFSLPPFPGISSSVSSAFADDISAQSNH